MKINNCPSCGDGFFATNNRRYCPQPECKILGSRKAAKKCALKKLKHAYTKEIFYLRQE